MVWRGIWGVFLGFFGGEEWLGSGFIREIGGDFE